MSWTIRYFDGTSWVQKTDAVIVSISQELNGHEEAIFVIPDTADNRTFANTDYEIQILFSGNVIFHGVLKGAKIGYRQIECIVYDKVLERMKRKVITKSYDNVSVDTILGDIASVAGVVKGSSVLDTVSIEFNNISCFDAVKMLVKVLGIDFWTTTSTNAINIGNKGVNRGAVSGLLEGSSWTIDRSKKKNFVIVQGRDVNGNLIVGTATDTNPEKSYEVFVERKVTTQSSLDSLANTLLGIANNDKANVRIEMKITSAYLFVSGDTITVNDTNLGLSGTFRISRIVKYVDRAVIDTVSREQLLEHYIERLGGFSDFGFYMTPSYQLSENVNLGRDINLVPNGDFEFDRDSDNKPDSWTFVVESGSASGGLTGNAVRGNKCVFISVSGTGRAEWLSDYISVLPDTVYSISLFVRADTAVNVSGLVNIIMYDANKNEVGRYVPNPNFIPTTWTSMVDSFTIPADGIMTGNVRYVRVMLFVDLMATNTIYFDNVVVVKAISTWVEFLQEQAISFNNRNALISVPSNVWFSFAYIQNNALEKWERYVVIVNLWYQLNAGDTRTNFRIAVRVVDSYTGLIYPINNSSTFDQIVHEFNGNDEWSSKTYYFLLPGDISKHTIYIDVRHNKTSSINIGTNITAYGIKQHTHS